MGRGGSTSSSSSLESSNYPVLSSRSSLYQHQNRDLSTDLRLGLSISTSQHPNLYNSIPSESDWPPIKPLLKKALAAEEENECNSATFYVKVYMEGIPIGRKLDLLAHDGYHDLIATLDHMFSTNILWAEMDCENFEQCHVLTYEDKEGDWLIVGDVPWEMFLSSVKRLKITKADI
ncbi:auxin-responsive protein IAA30 [Ricinus communis]|uniref:Auxin-responsive protein n=1 Tax=Ricinus communis TaxID=3988 RepID=B9RN35_RICCO|nr:auxin-responsive protein IAA30 [Ricinus communis]EEF47158.1 Auxin-responsive protein IAA20, putative [Ricinus communis]|eukprot:XP_002515174.1 auxin-responsive protein IAA30 [Ricinus communis]